MWKKNILFLLMVLILPVAGFVDGTADPYDVDYSDPSDVVESAISMMLNYDYESLLDVMEDGQKDKTLEMIDLVESDSSYKSELEENLERVIDFDVIYEDIFTNESTYYSIVNTRWFMEFSGSEPTTGVTVVSESEREYDTQYVDYLLQDYDGQWMIISQRNK